MSGVKSGVLCHRAARVVHRTDLSHRHHVWQQLFEQQDITVIVLFTIYFYPWVYENHTSALVPGDTD